MTATGPEALLLCLADPYVMIYGLWPIAVLVIAKSVSESYRSVLLIRLGGSRGYYALAASAGVVVAVFVQFTAVCVALLTTLSLPWTPHRADLHTTGVDLVAPLNPRSATTGAVGIDAAIQVAYFLASCILLALLMALIRAHRGSMFHLAVGLMLVTPPILLKIWPAPLAIVNPINFLLAFRARDASLPWSIPILAALASLVWVGRLAPVLARLLLARLDRAWIVYGSLVLVGTFLMFRGVDAEHSSLSVIFYGGATESMSLLGWSFAMIFWHGLALVITLQWSSFINERAWVELLRHGSAVKKVIQGLASDVLAVFVASLTVLLPIGIYDLARHAVVPWSAAEVVQHLVVGPAIVMSITSISLAVMWATGREWAAIVVVTVCVVGAFPMPVPWWPFPFALMFQSNVLAGATTEVTRVAASLLTAVASVCALLVVVRKCPVPSK